MAAMCTTFFYIFLLNIGVLYGQNHLYSENLERETLLNPIRIYAHFQDFDSHLSGTDVAAVKESVDIATIYLKQLLSVISVNGTLLLKRNACARSWLAGPNKGKCAYKRRDYNGEYCKGGFQIPDKHLEGFVVWEYNASEPRTWYRSDEGVSNADYILYVQAVTTSECVMANYKPNQKRLIAYAADCKQGKYALQRDIYGRPVAGYMNVCPSMLKESRKHKHKLILTIIHEILHNLGFSKEYFNMFHDCSRVRFGTECPLQRFPLYRKIGNYNRMLTSSVLRQMQKHFLCYEPDFGGPLDMKRHMFLKDSYIIQSHWDAKQMYGSIMAPSIGPPELTFVDPISLALLEDSGWYKVNYSNVDLYPWGHGKGCDFGNKLEVFDIGTCKFNNESIENGCNIFHTHKTVCSGTSTLDSDVLATNSCGMNEMSWNGDESVEKNSFLSRCLLSNITKSYLNNSFQSDTGTKHLKGECFKIRCLESKKMEVLINGSVSVPCPIGQIVDTSGLGLSGIIVCPHEIDLICFRRNTPLYLRIQPEMTTMFVLMTENITTHPRFDDILKNKEILRNNMTSKGRPLVFYEQALMKLFYTIIFCLILLHLKVNDRLLFCMF